MSPEFRSLLLKEWAERRSMFRLGMVLVVVLLGYCVAYELEYRTRALIASYYSMCMMMSPLAAVLLAMTTATGEYTRRTLKFSSSLPVPLSKVAWARLIGAWSCLVVPIVCGAIVLTPLFAAGLFEQGGLRMDHHSPNYVSFSDRPSISQFEAIGFLWTTTAISIVYVLNFSTLLSLVGTRCRNEGTVGFLGALLMLFSLMFTTARTTLDELGQYFLSDWIGAVLPASLAINWGYGDLDGSSYADLELAPLIFGPLAVNLLITMGIAIWFTRWYGCRVDALSSPTKSWRHWLPRFGMPAIAARLGIRWPGRFAALTWLNARQSVPLSVTGLMIAVLFTWVGLFESQASGILRVTEHDGTMTAELMGQLPSSTWFVGLLWAAIVAVGAFSSELKPGLEQFWRSRPISMGAWFWMKFTVGLIAVVGMLDVIPAFLAWSVPRSEIMSPQSNMKNMPAYLACMPLIHAQVYAVAVAAVCRLRRSILAAIIALLVFFVADSVLKSIPGFGKFSTIDVFNSLDQAGIVGERLDLTSAGYPIVYGIVMATIIGATVLARRTLLPPRASRSVTTTAILLVLCPVFCTTNVEAAEPPTAADILAGIKQREALVKDVRMKLVSKTYRPPAYFLQPELASRSRWSRDASKSETHESIYELSESPPRQVWSELALDGELKSRSAFDGKLVRHFSAKRSTLSSRIASTAPPGIPFTRPDFALMPVSGTSLTSLLEMDKPASIVEREVEEERLIDCTFTQTSSQITGVAANGRDATHVTREHRYQFTVNASRHYWPIRTNLDIVLVPDETIVTRIETTATDWIDAGPLVYPRKVTQLYYTTAIKDQPHKDGQSDQSPKLEHVTTNEAEITEIVVNTNPPDSIFAPSFPIGSVIHDQHDRKQYEVAADGTEQVYVPKPKGLRGAVFTYHLFWITAALAWLFVPVAQKPRV